MPSIRSIFHLRLDPVQRRILLVCGVVILVCLVILAIDHYLVDAGRTPPIEPEDGIEVELPDAPAPDLGAVDALVEESGRRQDELVEELERDLEELGAERDRTPEDSP